MFKLLVVCVVLAFIGLVFVESCEFKDKPCALPYSKKLQEEVVKAHNDYRSKANPSARNMEKMYWDDTMAKMALEFASRCKWGHNSYAERSFDGYSGVGQNVYGGKGNPTASWHAEIQYFTFGKKSSHPVGHYTQVMNDHAARIGCGRAYCPNIKWKYVNACHYLKGQSNYRTPYKLGKSCAACPKSCKNNLCDCGGKVCKRGAKLDLNTCKCKCDQNTSGELCDKVNCNVKENWQCRNFKRAGYCRPIYGYGTRNKCPITCGEC